MSRQRYTEEFKIEAVKQETDLQTENRHLKAELKPVSEERDILTKATVGMPPRTSPESPTEVRVYP